jgi:hypothetical protein
VVETTVNRLLCCGCRRNGKAMGQLHWCWWRICPEINVFSRFQYLVFYVLYPFGTYLLTLSYESYRQLVGLLGQVTTRSQGRYLHRTTKTQNKRRHPCIESDQKPTTPVFGRAKIFILVVCSVRRYPRFLAEVRINISVFWDVTPAVCHNFTQ